MVLQMLLMVTNPLHLQELQLGTSAQVFSLNKWENCYSEEQDEKGNNNEQKDKNHLWIPCLLLGRKSEERNGRVLWREGCARALVNAAAARANCEGAEKTKCAAFRLIYGHALSALLRRLHIWSSHGWELKDTLIFWVFAIANPGYNVYKEIYWLNRLLPALYAGNRMLPAFSPFPASISFGHRCFGPSPISKTCFT